MNSQINMIQDVKIRRLHIRKQGERHYFQINLPRQAERIVGIELGAFFRTAIAKRGDQKSDYLLTVKRNRVCGEVQLQTTGRSNFFFTGQLVQEDINDRFTVMSPYEGKVLPALWNSSSFSSGGRKELDEVLLEKEKIIYGCYKDAVGKSEGKDFEYTVLLYVWFEYED